MPDGKHVRRIFRPGNRCGVDFSNGPTPGDQRQGRSLDCRRGVDALRLLDSRLDIAFPRRTVAKEPFPKPYVRNHSRGAGGLLAADSYLITGEYNRSHRAGGLDPFLRQRPNMASEKRPRKKARMNAPFETNIAPQPNAQDASLTAVGRCIGDLRRGMAIVLRDGPDAMLVTAAESCVDPRALTMLTDTEVACLITASRAGALDLDTHDAPVVAIEARGGLDREAIGTIIGETLDSSQLAEPVAKPATPMQRTALEVVKLARLLPAALTSPINSDATEFAKRYNLLALDIANIPEYRGAAGALMDYTIDTVVPLEGAEQTRMIAFRPADGGKAHVAIVIGDPDENSPVLARLHSECFTGDLFGSLRCDCGDQLRGAVAAIEKAGGGVLLYLAQEGRGIGLVNKLRAYKLQDDGFDTIDANEQLGFDADERVYAPAAMMLRRLGFTCIQLMTNNPDKVAALEAQGIAIENRVAHAFPSNQHNEQYLQAKATRSGHLF